MALAPLSVGAVATLASGSRIDAASLHARTGGNPFFVVEVLAGEQAGLPTTVRDTVLARAAHLSGPARDCLDAAAVLGRHATADLVVEISESGVAAVDECVAAALLVSDGHRLAFRHDLAREAIEEGMTPLRRRQLHRLAVGALGDSDDVVQRAHHALCSGDRQVIVDLATRAGDACVALGAHKQAATLYERALEHDDALAPSERLRVMRAYATTCLHIDQVAEAAAAGDRVHALLLDDGDDVALGDWERWLSSVRWATGHPDEAWTLVSSAVRRLEPHGRSPALARATAQLAAQHMLSGRFPEAIANGRRALELADELNVVDAAVRARDVLGTSLCATGDDEGLSLLHEALDRAKAAGLYPEACVASANLGSQYVGRCELERAVVIFSDAVALAEDHELLYRRNCLLITRQEAYHLLARWDDAVADSQIILGQTGIAAHHRAIALATIGRIRARRGEPDPSTSLDEALEIVVEVGEPQFIHPVRMARAEAAWLAGDTANARAEVEATLPIAELLEVQDVRELEHWARRVGLDWSSDVHDAISAVLSSPNRRAAATFWDDCGCPYDAADVLADSDDEQDLRDALERLLALEARPRAQHVARRLRQLGARNVPRGPRASTRANGAGLTARELEIAALLVDGLTNAAIADRLVLSPKTVDHHVSGVLSKLGVGNRRHVATAARELGIELTGAEPVA
jgi:DNA-binding CsgD family transcriptional regulator/tetratricopeptide (TPR) repeat protein